MGAAGKLLVPFRNRLQRDRFARLFSRVRAVAIPGPSEKVILVHDDCRSSGPLDRVGKPARERRLAGTVNAVDGDHGGVSEPNHVAGELLTASVNTSRHHAIISAADVSGVLDSQQAGAVGYCLGVSLRRPVVGTRERWMDERWVEGRLGR